MWLTRTASRAAFRRLPPPRHANHRAFGHLCACFPSIERQSRRWSEPPSPASALPRQHLHRFHSYDRPAAGPRDVFGATEKALLSAATRHVPEHGFSSDALSLGALDAGYPDISPTVLPDGLFSLVRWHLSTQREALSSRSLEIFQGHDTHLTVTDKVRRLTWERLLGNRTVIRRWQEALAIMAQPSYVTPSLKELSLLVDDILFLAGDNSVDSSWYTKRASLAAIYAATELFMTNDMTPGFEDTKKFLERRFDEEADICGKIVSSGQWLGFNAAALVNVLRSKGARI